MKNEIIATFTCNENKRIEVERSNDSKIIFSIFYVSKYGKVKNRTFLRTAVGENRALDIAKAFAEVFRI